MTSYVYDQDWLDLFNTVAVAAEVVADEVRQLEAEVAKQIAKVGQVQEAASVDQEATSLDGIFERAITEKL
jgi:hypothetical protein